MNATYELETPLQKVKTITIAKYQIQHIVVDLFSGCTIYLALYDEKSKLVEDIKLEMKQADYALWNNDDNYMVDWINAELESKYTR